MAPARLRAIFPAIVCICWLAFTLCIVALLTAGANARGVPA